MDTETGSTERRKFNCGEVTDISMRHAAGIRSSQAKEQDMADPSRQEMYLDIPRTPSVLDWHVLVGVYSQVRVSSCHRLALFHPKLLGRPRVSFTPNFGADLACLDCGTCPRVTPLQPRITYSRLEG